MVTMTPEIIEFVNENLCWVTTISPEGELDLGPKMSMFVLDDSHLAYHERTGGKVYENLKSGSPLVVACANLAEKVGYRFRGTVTLHTEGELFDEQVRLAAERGTKAPVCIPVLEITQIDDLTSGANAGKRIA
ncbi:pyridoxamine 5'-phosphate oxidase family protein [Bifidobacterium gallicum]|uniref:Flavin-nucleotide-binding protein n=1 Tax=Bifidobacterium gallicum DSM 20093 = LMG 11596 TaxID=561180 RepID=D1NTV0_9BIFI|nr:pyridoxamine 5'-phosphate oxidase family protein [Bifidobacterium gallicum]EFA23154.1 pyridoxamine 5'-phosphate oxidase family protein [Bifidobacterium gallicum DSM 20093 = LMG 11596]KFI58825.1 flavin-nucleotide-binding protein [Bifidobacterium gallicum DSM 20093 = LMG 11596]